MGLFGKRKKENGIWNDVYYQSARFGKKADGTIFGLIVLHDNTKTAIAKDPQAMYNDAGCHHMPEQAIALQN